LVIFGDQSHEFCFFCVLIIWYILSLCLITALKRAGTTLNPLFVLKRATQIIFINDAYCMTKKTQKTIYSGDGHRFHM
jgi:hypothetical protein